MEGVAGTNSSWVKVLFASNAKQPLVTKSHPLFLPHSNGWAYEKFTLYHPESCKAFKVKLVSYLLLGISEGPINSVLTTRLSQWEPAVPEPP